MANSWKDGLARHRPGKDEHHRQKEEFEADLTKWIEEDNGRKERYGHILPEYKRLYDEWKEYYLAYNYTNDVFQ